MIEIERWKPRGRPVAGTAAAMAALAVCWVAGTASAEDAPKAGGTLIVARQNQAQCIDPQQDNYGYGSFDGRELVDSLTDQSYADPTRFAPWLAESWEINKDASSYVFHLRKDVTFSDGTRLDAKIVKDNFDTLAKIPGAAGASYLKDATVTVVDPATIRIDFKEPNVPFLAAARRLSLASSPRRRLPSPPSSAAMTGSSAPVRSSSTGSPTTRRPSSISGRATTGPRRCAAIRAKPISTRSSTR